MSEFTLNVTDLNERLFMERALAWYREMRTVCREAPDGQVLSQAEVIARDGGRELVRRSFQAVLQEQAREVEKKGRAAGPVCGVQATGVIAGAGDAST
jgi:hypothetical protein